MIRGGVTDVDEQEPRPIRPQQIALSERFDRRRMGTGRTADPAGQDWRWQAHGDHAGGGERLDVHSLDRLSVAPDPGRPAAEKPGYDYFHLWTYYGTLEPIHQPRCQACR